MIRKGAVNCDVGVRRPEMDLKTAEVPRLISFSFFLFFSFVFSSVEEAALNAVFQVRPKP